MKKITRTITSTEVKFHTFTVDNGQPKLSELKVCHLDDDLTAKPEKVQKEVAKIAGVSTIVIDSVTGVNAHYEMSVADFINHATRK